MKQLGVGLCLFFWCVSQAFASPPAPSSSSYYTTTCSADYSSTYSSPLSYSDPALEQCIPPPPEACHKCQHNITTYMVRWVPSFQRISVSMTSYDYTTQGCTSSDGTKIFEDPPNKMSFTTTSLDLGEVAAERCITSEDEKTCYCKMDGTFDQGGDVIHQDFAFAAATNVECSIYNWETSGYAQRPLNPKGGMQLNLLRWQGTYSCSEVEWH
jgi:hypothetical protein